jgi:hypothetical protein
VRSREGSRRRRRRHRARGRRHLALGRAPWPVDAPGGGAHRRIPSKDTVRDLRDNPEFCRVRQFVVVATISVPPGCLRATRFSAANEILSSWIRLQRTPRRARVERARASSVSSPGRARTNHTRCLDDIAARPSHPERVASVRSRNLTTPNSRRRVARRRQSTHRALRRVPRAEAPRPTLRETEPVIRPR